MQPPTEKPATKKYQTLFNNQPLTCPWNSAQPYPNASSRNHTEPSTSCNNKNKATPTIQQSSTQFFYFLRLMQLFPETHPATIHTVLTLCNNNFFQAVDKLLYAKKCKALYNRNQSSYRRSPYERSQTSAGHVHSGVCRKEEVINLKQGQKFKTTSKVFQEDLKKTEYFSGRTQNSTCVVEAHSDTSKCTCQMNSLQVPQTNTLVTDNLSNQVTAYNDPISINTEFKNSADDTIKVRTPELSSDTPTSDSSPSKDNKWENLSELSPESQTIIKSDIIILK
ncbi:uncharacterized protein LOC126887311 [Diabrotica virgifera virgifera]|uniref:Uncharacterized protein n=1 Tax=Diabrotica virgifera virgifera TaxID=50390 RepID=A0ABM5KKH0_DIAVI|nr:uncharacterized protein LOC126887311 [Diabrotica virgifera virgifera]